MSVSSKKKSITPHLVSILISVVIATAMWYTVSVRDRIEAQFDVSIDYTGIPKNLIVTDGLINKITVRMRGPETLLRSLNTQHLNQQIDLSLIKKGVTIVPLTTERLAGYYRAFELLDVQPPRIVVKADVIVERAVPVQPVITSPLRSGALTVEKVSVEPSSVTLWGPESVISEITSLRLPIVLDPKAAGTTVSQTLPLDSPGLVTVTPKNVRVSYTITSRRTVTERRYHIGISSEKPGRYAIEPGEVKLSVEVPEALAKSASYLNGLHLSVLPPMDMKPGEKVDVPLHYRIPDGMSILPPKPTSVRIYLRD